jgi:hypothetical protein
MSSLLEAKALDEEQALSQPIKPSQVRQWRTAFQSFEFSAEVAHIRSLIEASYLQHLFNNLLV